MARCGEGLLREGRWHTGLGSGLGLGQGLGLGVYGQMQQGAAARGSVAHGVRVRGLWLGLGLGFFAAWLDAARGCCERVGGTRVRARARGIAGLWLGDTRGLWLGGKRGVANGG